MRDVNSVLKPNFLNMNTNLFRIFASFNIHRGMVAASSAKRVRLLYLYLTSISNLYRDYCAVSGDRKLLQGFAMKP